MTTTVSEFRREQQISSVRVASSANVSGTYYNGPSNSGVGATLTIAASSLTVDSVVMEENDRLLLFAQTSALQNGVYMVQSIGATVVLERAYDFQEAHQMVPGYFMPVEAGSEFAGAIFAVVEPQVQVVGVDDIVIQNAGASISTATFENTGLKIENPAGTFVTTIIPTDAITANRSLNIDINDADRTLTFTGNAVLNQDVSTAGNPAFASVTVANDGLHVLDTNATHDLVIRPGSNLTADRDFTLTTGDNARTLDISAANVTVSAFGATLVDDAAASNARTTLQVVAAATANIGGAGAGPISVAVAGFTANTVMVATIASSSNVVSVAKCIGTATGFDVTFSGDPGAACVLNYIGVGA